MVAFNISNPVKLNGIICHSIESNRLNYKWKCKNQILVHETDNTKNSLKFIKHSMKTKTIEIQFEFLQNAKLKMRKWQMVHIEYLLLLLLLHQTQTTKQYSRKLHLNFSVWSIFKMNQKRVKHFSFPPVNILRHTICTHTIWHNNWKFSENSTGWTCTCRN